MIKRPQHYKDSFLRPPDSKDILLLRVDSPAYGGISIARHKGRVVMISGAAMPGELVEVKIDKDKKDYLTASVVKIIEPSPDRIEPECKFFGLCGGCHIQFISYKRQVGIKEEILRDCLRRLAKSETELSEPIVDEHPWNYRLRGQFKIHNDSIGFYREKTREVVDIDRCPLMADEINEYLKKARVLLRGINKGEIHISGGDGVMALIQTHVPTKAKSGAERDQLAERFLNSGFSGLFVQDGTKKISIYGRQYLTMGLEGLQYTISPLSFFQSHWRLNQAVVKFIKNALQPLMAKKILDLYSGAGNFSLPLAPDAQVVAVEENQYAIEDGIRNLKINNAENYRFIRATVEHFDLKEKFDVVIIDPPRQGIADNIISMLLAALPETIVYISCNPATFSRDLKKLAEKYNIEFIKMIDFFPQTYHIEALAYLKAR